MNAFHITGGIPLRGTVAVSGSKNAALPIMAASILAEGPVRLEGVPRLDDVDSLTAVLGDLGVVASRTADDALFIETVDDRPIRARYEWMRRMRASFCVLGPLLARRRRATVSLPGGCNIGDRPVDLHLKGLAALGAKLRMRRGYVVARAGRLVGATVDLLGPCGPTVTGTANVLSAAVLAEGTTTIRGAAAEPEIVDLGRFLIAMGARIDGLGTSTIQVDGVRRLSGVTYRVIPDRIEATTLLLAAAITRGSATITGVLPDHMAADIELLRAAGFELTSGKDHVSIRADRRPLPLEISARPYPGVATDVQAQWTALLSLAAGRSRVRDQVFPGRFLHLAELARLGAKIRRRGNTARVTGVARLHGTHVTASDLRASAALVLAALAAEGTTTIHAIHHLDRGYQQLAEKLTSLGARIRRVVGSSVRGDRIHTG